jgi:FMN-dependent NADH-azoreductase
MKTLLLINTSPDLVNSVSRQLTALAVNEWKRKFSDGIVTERDIGKYPIPHLLQDSLDPINSPKQVTEKGMLTRELFNKLIAEIKSADFIIFGVPMFNLSIPSTLKAYFDHIAIAGETWGGVDYGKSKQVVVITTGGSLYQGSEYDFQGPYIREFLKTIDLENSTFIRADGLYKSAEMRESSLSNAKLEIKKYINCMHEQQLLSVNTRPLESTDYLGEITDLTKAIVLNPKSPELYLHRGDFYYALKQYELASNDYSSAIVLDPINPIYYCNRAEAKRQLKDLDGSIIDLKTAINFDNPQDQQVDYPYYRIARDLAKNKLISDSPTLYAKLASKAYIGFFKKLNKNTQEKKSYMPYALYYLGRCHETGCGTEKNLHKAKQYYQKASEQVLPTEMLAYKLNKRLNNLKANAGNSQRSTGIAVDYADLLQIRRAKL